MIYQECLTLINVPFPYYYLWNVLCVCTCVCAHMCADTCLWGVHTCLCLCKKKPEYNLRCHFSGVRCHLCFCVYVHVCECRHMHERLKNIWCLSSPTTLFETWSLSLIAHSYILHDKCNYSSFSSFHFLPPHSNAGVTDVNHCIYLHVGSGPLNSDSQAPTAKHLTCWDKLFSHILYWKQDLK